MERRILLKLLLAAGCLPRQVWSATPEFPDVLPRPLVFPRDHGAHPEFRTEWWYVTGWLESAGAPIGFQVTFFRSRTGHAPDNPSRFAPHQLLFAHVAVANPEQGQLRHDQRAARIVPGDPAVSYSTEGTRLVLDGWRFERSARGDYKIAIAGEGLALDLRLEPTQALLLQGDAGFSRKGLESRQASHYYSQPHLAVTGAVIMPGKTASVRGRAWLDHEWSSRVLDADASGWDWIGINLDDGSALMAFRIRDRRGSRDRWASARWRGPDGRIRDFGGEEVRFETRGTWRSPHTGTVYPVRCRIKLGDGRTARTFDLEPLMDDQELDARRSTGAVYWEGAVRALASGHEVGRGYLELVGYHRPMML